MSAANHRRSTAHGRDAARRRSSSRRAIRCVKAREDVLSSFVLIVQNRAERIDELREEVDLQIDMIAPINVEKIERVLEGQIVHRS